MTRVWQDTAGKGLFFVCPTDRIEALIEKKYRGEAYFYSALGVYVEFDFKTQHDLIDMISTNRIDQIVFISSMGNAFYKRALDEPQKWNYPVSKALVRAREKNAGQCLYSPAFFSNPYRLVAGYLQDQKERLLSTDYLGKYVEKEAISVEVYAFQPHKGEYYSPEELCKTGQLLERISVN